MSNTMIKANSVESDPEDSTGMNYDGPIVRSTIPGLTFSYQQSRKLKDELARGNL
jgi:hypothetical protein